MQIRINVAANRDHIFKETFHTFLSFLGEPLHFPFWTNCFF